MAKPNAEELVAAADISMSYATKILRGERTPPLDTAFRIYDATGHGFGLLSNLTASEVEMQRRLIQKARAA